MQHKIDFNKVKRGRLSTNTPGIYEFKNKEHTMMNFIQNQAIDDQVKRVGTTWTWVYDNKTLIGFVSFAMFSIDRRKTLPDKQGKYPYTAIPSLLIGQLATHSDYECNGLGKQMMMFAIRMGYRASKNYGCRVVALHPLPTAISWYREQTPFKLIEKEGNIMYLDLMLNKLSNFSTI